MKTNLKTIIKFRPCSKGIAELMNNLGHLCVEDNWEDVYNSLTPEQQTKDIDFKFILESNGVKDTFWALRTQPKKTRMLISVAVVHTYAAAAYIAAVDVDAVDERWKKNEEILREYI